MSKQPIVAGNQFSNYVELIRFRAQAQANQRAVTFLPNGEKEEGFFTYADLDRRARCIAAELQARGASGERVLLVYHSSLEYVAAFIGCLYAGAIAVPIYPPRFNRNLLRLQSIVADATPQIALTSAAILNRIQPALHENNLHELSWLASDQLQDLEEHWREPSITGNTLAFLQYTSGSTATPKGVMVSHSNLLENNAMIQEELQQDSQSVTVLWLPLFHDMGLIGNLLQSFYLGSQCFMMPPEAFVVKPVRWLQAIERYEAHTSGGPNFSYDLCVNKITPEQKATLDLSCWQVAFNGAEPVRAKTLARFAEEFAPCGFRPSALYPCYGLAEATLFVSGRHRSTQPKTLTVDAAALENNTIQLATKESELTRTLVSCGHQWLDEEVAIVNPVTLTRCPMGTVGEIWVAGPHVTAGYWNRPEVTEHDFNARIADADITNSYQGPYLRSGDLGFIHEGQLYIAGRLKDLIIIGGRNHYPSDLEATVESCHADLRPAGSAAFSIEHEGEEVLAIVAEVERSSLGSVDMKGITAAIRQSIAEQHELRAHTIKLLPPGALPKTSSAKTQRHLCRTSLLDNSLNILQH
jgi:acyl-CoA synthetase (AMP-forming)/AMP-acid ligase II